MASKEDSVCFNCFGQGHVSLFCPQNQNWTRCPSCRRVVFESSGHKDGCSFASTFVSTKIQTIAIGKVESILDMQLKDPKDVSIVDASGNLILLEDGTSVIVGAMIMKIQNDIVLIEGPEKVSRTIVIENALGQARVKLVIGSCLEINGRYTISTNGVVRYMQGNTNYVSTGTANCRIRINEERLSFWIRFGWKGSEYYVQVFPTGVLLRDDTQPILQSQLLDMGIYCKFHVSVYIILKCLLFYDESKHRKSNKRRDYSTQYEP